MDRRDFMLFMGGTALMLQTGCSGKPTKKVLGPPPIVSLPPQSRDQVTLSDGLDYKILISRGNKINKRGQRFGDNNDYTQFLTLNENEGLLWVNHESFTPLFVSGYKKGIKRTKRQVDKERRAVGGSLLHLERAPGGHWTLKLNSPYAKRFDGTTKIPFVGGTPFRGDDVAIGTLANCSGGLTPWGTILSCEENYDNFYGERLHGQENIKAGKYRWNKYYSHPPENYGWVVEIDPKRGKAKKHLSMGRFAHECATVHKANGKVAVYSGDDKEDECLYKFVSDSVYDLEKGTLYVANLEQKKWIPLDIKKQPQLQKAFSSQQEVLTYTRKAAHLVGGTPLHRPEDIAISPVTGEIFVALTNHKKKNDYFGKIIKVSEKGDYASEDFEWQTFAFGGPELGFACPDNLTFDKKGNLWMSTDISGSSVGEEPYESYQHNGIFYIPMSGDYTGRFFQVASAPVDAEFTGMSFSEDGETLFVSVQHPGEKSKSLKRLKSHWPKGGKAVPLSSVIQVRGSIIRS